MEGMAASRPGTSLRQASGLQEASLGSSLCGDPTKLPQTLVSRIKTTVNSKPRLPTPVVVKHFLGVC